MAKDKIADYDASAAANTDIGGIGIQGTNAVSNFDGAFREIMSQLKEADNGTSPLTDTWSFCDPSDRTKIFRIDAGSITTGTTRVYTAPNASGTLALLGLAQTWTVGVQDFQGGANVVDSTFTIVDNGDQTKKIAFQASSITTGTTRTFTAPNASGTLALVDVAQTWSGGVQDFQAGATVVDSSFSIKDNGDQTRIAAFSAGGITTGTTRTFTFPDADGTFALVSSGTFTPTVSGTSTAGTGTYTTQEGGYIKIGNLVHFKIKLVWTAHTGTGNIRIAGLPFSSATPLNDVFTIYAEDLTFSNTLACTFGTANTLALKTISTGAAAGNVAMDTAATLQISGSYISV